MRKGIVMNYINELSSSANEMLHSACKKNTINNKAEIIEILKTNDLPISDAVVNLQAKYGGISYRFSDISLKGFEIDLFDYDPERKLYKVRYTQKFQEEIAFNCMNYHYAGDFGNFINESGQILKFSMGKLSVIADTIEEFLESEAVKYQFLKEQNQWFERGFYLKEFRDWITNEEIGLYKLEKHSNRYKQWYTNKEEDIFIEYINHDYEINGGSVFIKNKTAMLRLYNNLIKSSGYPFSATYNFNENYIEIFGVIKNDSSNQKYYCQTFEKINNPIGNEPIDVFYYMSGV